MPEDTLTRLHKRRESPGDWTDDWRDITGTEFGIAEFVRRIHPDDVARVITDYVRAHRTGRCECRYRLLDKDNVYRCVRAEGIRIGEAWVATIHRIPQQDKPCWIIPIADPNRKHN